VSEAVQKNVPVQLFNIGNVEAYNTVSIRARVGGELQKVFFKEGDEIKEGSALFLLDPRPYAAALRQTEANLVRDIVQAQKDYRDTKRYEGLIGKGVVSKEQYDQVRTAADAAEAAVKADRAAVENAKLQLEYCTILSPISGRTGKLMIQMGNMIKANDETPLVVINQITPIYVTFAMPEKDLPEIKRSRNAGAVKVEAIIPESTAAPVAGELTFIDNAVNITTGTILLKATFANTDRALWPGQFVKVVLTLSTRPNAVVIPSQAVQTGQSGPYVFVVKKDLAAEMRAVVPGSSHNGETVIEKGVKPGETVVTDGQLQLSTGAKVEIKKTERQGS
ncbi:MAG: efflux RND transporter periplasmic adaptor subunit, partial [Proteobacteria bacterium]|nr:efflux RND transporter periplasmic adaptor subunit [Pseudomonadota bacterium]